MSGPVRIAHIYPELLGTYGDGGNVEVLSRRLEWRGLRHEVSAVSLGDPIPHGDQLIVVIGGGEDGAQTRAAPWLASLLPQLVADGAVVFAVCAGLQLLGHSFETADGSTCEGVGLLDLVTTAGSDRAVGEVSAQPLDPTLPPLTGFANHGGRTILGNQAAPLARVQRGPANHPGGNDEGAVQGRVIGTYLHGPALARNPALADRLLELATGAQLEPLADEDVERLRRQRLESA